MPPRRRFHLPGSPPDPSVARRIPPSNAGGPLDPFSLRDGDPAMDADQVPDLRRIPDAEDDFSAFTPDMDYSKRYDDPRVVSPAPQIVTIGTAAHVAGPVDGNGSGGGGTEPDLITRTRVFKGGPFTSSLILMLKPAPNSPAVAAAGGFDLTIWIRDRGAHLWGATSLFTLPYSIWEGTGDFNGGELFFQIGNVAADGNLWVHVLEQF